MKRKPHRPFIPDWIPEAMKSCLELEELAADDGTIADEAGRLGQETHAHVAAYRASALGRPHGLCSVYRAAVLSEEGLRRLQAAEALFPGVVFVAYARPLRRHGEA